MTMGRHAGARSRHDTYAPLHNRVDAALPTGADCRACLLARTYKPQHARNHKHEWIAFESADGFVVELCGSCDASRDKETP